MSNWRGFRELVVVDKIEECVDIISFYFKAKDGGKLVRHEAGQYLPFQVKTDDERYKSVLRTYSLSSHPSEEIYRISVKRIEGGLMSNYLHKHLNIGDTIEAMVPAGLFTISNEVRGCRKPLVLISGGIGITPILSMAYEQVNRSVKMHIVQAVQNSQMHPFQQDVKVLGEKEDVDTTVFYSTPLETDQLGKDYDKMGFINKEWLKESVPLTGEFYLCGPPPFMRALEQYLLELGVKIENIHYELFSV